MVESSRIAVYSVPCGLAWGADVALITGEADIPVEVLASRGVTD